MDNKQLKWIAWNWEPSHHQTVGKKGEIVFLNYFLQFEVVSPFLYDKELLTENWNILDGYNIMFGKHLSKLGEKESAVFAALAH